MQNVCPDCGVAHGDNESASDDELTESYEHISFILDGLDIGQRMVMISILAGETLALIHPVERKMARRDLHKWTDQHTKATAIANCDA